MCSVYIDIYIYGNLILILTVYVVICHLIHIYIYIASYGDVIIKHGDLFINNGGTMGEWEYHVEI